MFQFFTKSKSQKIKSKARESLSQNISNKRKNYVVDTSAIINKFLSQLSKNTISGKVIVPNAVMAELEHLANKGLEVGFLGLEEVTNLHKLRNINIMFDGPRPTDSQIKRAKSGEIDALIREIARRNKASLITADLVQAKSAQAYGLDVIFLRPEIKKKKFFSFLFKQSN